MKYKFFVPTGTNSDEPLSANISFAILSISLIKIPNLSIISFNSLECLIALKNNDIAIISDSVSSFSFSLIDSLLLFNQSMILYAFIKNFFVSEFVSFKKSFQKNFF